MTTQADVPVLIPSLESHMFNEEAYEDKENHDEYDHSRIDEDDDLDVFEETMGDFYEQDYDYSRFDEDDELDEGEETVEDFYEQDYEHSGFDKEEELGEGEETMEDYDYDYLGFDEDEELDEGEETMEDYDYLGFDEEEDLDEGEETMEDFYKQIRSIRVRRDKALELSGPPYVMKETSRKEIGEEIYRRGMIENHDESNDNNYGVVEDHDESSVDKYVVVEHYNVSNDDKYGVIEDHHDNDKKFGVVDDYDKYYSDENEIYETVKDDSNELMQYGEYHLDPYYAVDDDAVKATTDGPEYEGCRRTSFHKLHQPICNKFHELDLLHDATKFLGEGFYRNSFVMPTWPSLLWGESQDASSIPKAVLKSIKQSGKYQSDMITHMEFQRIDALVMNVLSESPRTLIIYGHCAMALLTEFLSTEIEGLVVPHDPYIAPDTEEELQPMNNLTVDEKLKLSLEMAEAISDMHGHKGGPIAHVDLKLDQFMRGRDGILKIIDFNRAEVMMWDEGKKKYCGTSEGPRMGHFHSPEEISNEVIDEKVDVYLLGSMIYAVLTGLWIHTNIEDDDLIQVSDHFFCLCFY